MSVEIRNYRQAAQFLGLPVGALREEAMRAWKREHVAARRAGDTDREVLLSQCRTAIRRGAKGACNFPGCGVVISWGSRCRMHQRNRAAYREFSTLKLRRPIEPTSEGAPTAPLLGNIQQPTSNIQQPMAEKRRTLSEAQREILRRRAAGVSFKEIAFERRRSIKTVEYHWAAIQRFLGMRDVVAICRWWWEREQLFGKPKLRQKTSTKL